MSSFTDCPICHFPPRVCVHTWEEIAKQHAVDKRRREQEEMREQQKEMEERRRVNAE